MFHEYDIILLQWPTQSPELNPKSLLLPPFTILLLFVTQQPWMLLSMYGYTFQWSLSKFIRGKRIFFTSFQVWSLIPQATIENLIFYVFNVFLTIAGYGRHCPHRYLNHTPIWYIYIVLICIFFFQKPFHIIYFILYATTPLQSVVNILGELSDYWMFNKYS